MSNTVRPMQVFPITTRELQVLDVQDVTPGMRRVTLGGPGLHAHDAPNGLPVREFRSAGFDDEFKLVLKHPDAERPLVPAQGEGRLIWALQDPHLVMRTYTVRTWDAAAGRLDVDLVRHPGGAAAQWAEQVAVGDVVNIAGPKMSGGQPQDTDWILAAGDETALPAIGRWLEEWPAGMPGQVFVLLDDPAHRQDLAVPDGVEVTWVDARTGPDALLDALRDAAWWDGRPFAWVAGEAGLLRGIRRWLRDERAVPKDHLDITGYWIRPADRSAGQDAEPEAESGELHAVSEQVHEMAELLPAVALRIAVTMGLPRVLTDAPLRAEAVADACGAEPTATAKLLRYLATLGVVRYVSGGYAITALGAALEEEMYAEALNLDRHHARRELAGALALAGAVLPRTVGTDWALIEETDTELHRTALEQEAEFGRANAEALATHEQIAGSESFLLAGRAVGHLAQALLANRGDEVSVTVLAVPSHLPDLRRLYPDERITWCAGSVLAIPEADVDMVLLCDVLPDLREADAAHVLATARGALRPGGAVLIADRVAEADEPDEHACEADLVRFALGGAGLRSRADYEKALAAAGFAAPQRSTVGWGVAVLAAPLAN